MGKQFSEKYFLTEKVFNLQYQVKMSIITRSVYNVHVFAAIFDTFRFNKLFSKHFFHTYISNNNL